MWSPFFCFSTLVGHSQFVDAKWGSWWANRPFPSSKNFTFKTRVSAKLFFRRWHLFGWELKNHFISLASPLASLKQRTGELGNGLLERLRVTFTANVNLYHATKFSHYLSFTAQYFYKTSFFTLFLSIIIVLSSFYMPHFILRNSQLETDVRRLP